MKTDPTQHPETLRRVSAFAGLALVLVASCGGVAPLYCDEETPCSDPDRPFCDLAGEFPESEGHGRTCIGNPFDGGTPTLCEPASVVCEGETRTTCDADGQVERVDTCALGCADDNTRCLLIDPSNGHRELLLEAETGPEIVLGDGASINTDTGIVRDGNGDTVAVPFRALPAPEPLGARLGVFLLRTIDLGNVTVEGSAALVLLVYDRVEIRGTLQLSATDAPGPGGSSSRPRGGQHAAAFQSAGASGATNGFFLPGRGGPLVSSTTGNPVVRARITGGTKFEVDLIPLRGGDSGGAEPGANAEGGGGGAVQIASGSVVRFHPGGSIIAGGAGGFRDDGIDSDSDEPGSAGAGGGGGGGILIEAAAVEIPANAGLAANGGGGGSYLNPGADANQLTTNPAAGGTGSAIKGGGGAGGTGTVDATDGHSRVAMPGNADTATAGGGGGGGAGRIRINTPQDDFSPEAGAILSPTPTTGLIPFF